MIKRNLEQRIYTLQSDLEALWMKKKPLSVQVFILKKGSDKTKLDELCQEHDAIVEQIKIVREQIRITNESLVTIQNRP